MSETVFAADPARLLIAAAAGIILLLLLIIKFKIHPVLSLLISALVIGLGAGIIRWVLQNCGMGDIIGPALQESGLPLILVAFLIAALVRASVGAAMVCAITGGATAFSHVNDSGFWLVSSLLEIDEKTTLKSWAMMETIIGFTGLICALVISIFA